MATDVITRDCGQRVTGVEHLDGVGAAILAANHASYIDSVVLMATIPTDFRFLAKRRLADYPFIGTVIRKVGHVTIETATVAQQLSGADILPRLLREGRQMLVFPEGTFFRPAELLPFRLGAFKAAVVTRCPIVPIALRAYSSRPARRYAAIQTRPDRRDHRRATRAGPAGMAGDGAVA